MSEMSGHFRAYLLPDDSDMYAALHDSVQWQQLGKGREGGVLVDPDDVQGVPIVRTTTQYRVPAQRYRPVHTELAQRIQGVASLPTAFNNALIERYTNAYAKMGMHCDQALDLVDDSAIAIFSCYEHPELVTEPRKLVVEAKGAAADGQSEQIEVPLVHNSVVVFSLETNQRFRHKIVLDRSSQPAENRWLGVTFRTSKTFVRIDGDRTVFDDGTALTLADGQQRNTFFSLRSRENKEVGFRYPRLTYTISESDQMPASG